MMMKIFGLNLYTWGGIISIFITYYLIQKGASIAATQNKKDIESKLDIVEKKAIKSIEDTADSTNKKINESANEIIDNLKNRVTSLNTSLEELEKQSQLSTKKIRKDILEKTEKTNYIVEVEGSETRDIVTSEALSSRDKISNEASKTREHVSKKINNNISILKKHMLEKLKPAIYEVKKTWFDLITNVAEIKHLNGNVSKEIRSKNTSLLNLLSDKVAKMRSEVRSTNSFVGDLIKKGNYEQVIELLKYLQKLDQPFNKTYKELFEKEKDKNFYDIQVKYYAEMYELEREFDSIYKNILKLE